MTSAGPDVRGTTHVEVRGVTKAFGGQRALSDVDLRVVRGTVHALVGENGAGKSTLGKIIGGALIPDAGEVLLDGVHCINRSPRSAQEKGITTIAQELAVVPARTVLENVFLGAERSRLGVVNRRVLLDRYAALCRQTGFDLPPLARAGSLRIADQQKVEVLRALARDASLIVFDEPTAALSREDTAHLLEVARGLRSAGKTLIWVSHFLDEVMSLADTITVLRDGVVVKTTPASAETPASLVESMLGRSLTLVFPEKAPPADGSGVVLRVEGLSRYSSFEDVSFELRRGEILGLAGLVGSGRSEVARAIFGADRADAGRISLAGVPVDIRSPRDAKRLGIGMLPESRKTQGLVMNRSLAENVALPFVEELGRAGVIGRRRERDRVEEVVRRLDIRAKGSAARVAELSGGNQQKAVFAKWLLQTPSILIVDEPTRGIDVGAKLAIYELLVRLANEGMAILLISSELEEVMGLAHRILVMRAGRIVAEFGADATEDTIMHAAFATHEDVAA